MGPLSSDTLESLTSNLQSRPQSVEQRRLAIATEVQRRGVVTVAQLAALFGLSPVSVRRDLDYLERQGLLRRAHGKAEALPVSGHIPSFDVRLFQNVEVKRAIGRAAASLIRPGDTVFLDAGTTVLAVARAIPAQLLEAGNLTVVTRSLVIASELRRFRGTRLVLLGGMYVHDFDDFVGEQVESSLRSIRVDSLFIGTDGVSLDRGLTTDNVLEVGLYRLMATCAKKVIVTADSSKIGRDQFQAFLPLDEVHVFVTDSAAPPDFIEGLRARGVEVIAVSCA